MNIKQTKIEIWFDKTTQSFFAFSEDKKSHAFLKNGGNNTINEMIEKIKEDLNSTNDEFPDYLRFLRENDGSWTIESYFDENASVNENGIPSIVDFINNLEEMDITLTDRGTLN
jgi:hypothetical protein